MRVLSGLVIYSDAQDQVGITVDANGHPLMNALTFPSGPRALIMAGSHLLAVCTDAVHVYDLEHSQLIQSLHFPLDQRPAPDQQFLACSKHSCNQNSDGWVSQGLFLSWLLEMRISSILM